MLRVLLVCWCFEAGEGWAWFHSGFWDGSKARSQSGFRVGRRRGGGCEGRDRGFDFLAGPQDKLILAGRKV